MNQISNFLTFTVPLSFEAHNLARQFSHQQSNPEKAKQIYLNTLAVYAVNFYLRCLGFQTDPAQSDSHNPLCLKFMDVADLFVKNLGKLECLPLLTDAQFCKIPPEVRADRIAYVPVKINRELKQAILLGFTTTAVAEISLEQLRSLAEFPEYLNCIQKAASSTKKHTVKLTQWFDNIFEAGWQEIEALLDLQKARPAFRMRSAAEPCRGKVVNLASPKQAVLLVVQLTRQQGKNINITVEIHPSGDRVFLPENLQVMVLNEKGVAVMQAIAGSINQNIQFDFMGEPGERISVQTVLEQTSVTENFVI
jgi:hypothetical protein